MEQESRRLAKKQVNWFSKNQVEGDLPYTTTLFVPPTEGSVLARTLQGIERQNNQGRAWGVKIVERRGTTVAGILCNSYPWPTLSCQAQDCFPCRSADPARPPKHSCRQPNISYQIICLTCKTKGEDSTYQGESHRNGYSRGL